MFNCFKYLKRNDSNFKSERKSISNPNKGEEYICVNDHKACGKSEITIKKNQKCFVIEKNLNGWCFVITEESQGYVPRIALEALNKNYDSEKIIVSKRNFFCCS